ncbi:MAG: (2Fe-2S)-binding protein, partial [Alphaproteobacteria bacterium]
KTVGRFRYPGIAELEFWGKNGLALVTTFHLRQVGKFVEGIGCLIGPRNGVLDYLKSLAIRPMFWIAVGQDRRVLKSASDNAQHFPDAPPVIGPLDFLRRDIKAIMAGALPSAAETPRTGYIEL